MCNIGYIYVKKYTNYSQSHFLERTAALNTSAVSAHVSRSLTVYIHAADRERQGVNRTDLFVNLMAEEEGQNETHHSGRSLE